MCGLKFLFAFLFLYGIATVRVEAQPPCQSRIYPVQPGQRFCERQCLTGPNNPGVLRCAVARIATTVRLCPPNCCRLGSLCQWLIRA